MQRHSMSSGERSSSNVLVLRASTRWTASAVASFTRFDARSISYCRSSSIASTASTRSAARRSFASAAVSLSGLSRLAGADGLVLTNSAYALLAASRAAPALAFFAARACFTAASASFLAARAACLASYVALTRENDFLRCCLRALSCRMMRIVASNVRYGKCNAAISFVVAERCSKHDVPSPRGRAWRP